MDLGEREQLAGKVPSGFADLGQTQSVTCREQLIP